MCCEQASGSRVRGGGETSACVMQAEWHSTIVAVKMLKRSDEIAMNDFRTELDVLQKVRRTLYP